MLMDVLVKGVCGTVRYAEVKSQCCLFSITIGLKLKFMVST